ncbi:MAG: hypothetical protein MI802_04525 [Desulfobacterales bacterium]|nr:hypothetical protein [Desulfobacterales bacterium]
MKTLFTPNTLKKLTLVLILLGIITGGAYASKFGGGQCTYVLNVKNSIGTVGSDAPGIIISNAKVHYLDFTQWKSTDAGSGTTGELSAGYTKTMTTTISYDLGKYSYKFSFD